MPQESRAEQSGHSCDFHTVTGVQELMAMTTFNRLAVIKPWPHEHMRASKNFQKWKVLHTCYSHFLRKHKHTIWSVRWTSDAEYFLNPIIYLFGNIIDIEHDLTFLQKNGNSPSSNGKLICNCSLSVKTCSVKFLFFVFLQKPASSTSTQHPWGETSTIINTTSCLSLSSTSCFLRFFFHLIRAVRKMTLRQSGSSPESGFRRTNPSPNMRQKKGKRSLSYFSLYVTLRWWNRSDLSSLHQGLFFLSFSFIFKHGNHTTHAHTQTHSSFLHHALAQ